MGSLIRLLAVLASLVVAVSLVLFVVDESGEATRGQVAKLDNPNPEAAAVDVNAPAPSAADERLRERVHGSTREAIDDANDVLLTPFAGVVGTGSVWAQRLVPAALALLIYGLGGLLLANFITPAPRTTQDWREATG